MIRRVAKRVLSTKVYAHILWRYHRFLDRVEAVRGQDTGSRDVLVLLAANGGGNIGDQALLEAALQSSQGSVVVLAKSVSHVEIPSEFSERVTVTSVPHLLDPLLVSSLRDHRQVRRLLRNAHAFWVVGADLMDGLYNPSASLSRASLLVSAHAFGCESRALGFSWPDRPMATVSRRLREADRVAALFARDPVSHSRMIEQGFVNVELSSDIVFSDSRVAPVPELVEIVSDWHSAGRMIAVVNASALIGSRRSQAGDYKTIFEALAQRGYAVVALPHVIRESGNDLLELRSILETCGMDSVDLLVGRLLTPAESRWLAGQADLVITGRMHLAVLALSSGVPTITLGTQGKVEGLYAFFGIPELAIEPVGDFGVAVAAAVGDIVGHQAVFVEAIQAALPRVVSLGSRSFEGLAWRAPGAEGSVGGNEEL